MTKPVFWGIRERLSLIVLLALLPTLLMFFSTAAEQRRLTVASVEENALQLLRFASVSERQIVEGTRQLLETMAQLPDVRDGNAAACGALFQNMLKERAPYLVFGLATLDGCIVCSVPNLPGDVIDITDRSYFQKAVNYNDFAVGEYQIGRSTGKATISFGYPVRNDCGRVHAVLYAALDLTSLDRLAEDVRFPEGSVFTIMDRNGTVLARRPDTEGWLGKPVPDPAVAEAIRGSRDEGTIMTLGPTPTLHAYSRVYIGETGNGLWVSVGIPAAVLYRSADRMFARNLLGLAFVFALALCVVWMGGELFVNRALRVLLSATDRLAKGDLVVRTNLRDNSEFGQLARAFDRMVAANATLIGDLQQSHVELTRAYEETLESLVRALDLRDHETEGHSRRVTEMTMRIARRLGMSGLDLVHLRRGALLHDIGKIGIPDSILLKPGPLTAEEWIIMRQHPVYAYELLSSISYLNRALDIPYCHHERWDGEGYPQGIRGEKIPIAARAFSVADVYDALRSERPYRAAWPKEKVCRHIRDQAGKQFDPRVVETLLEILEEAQRASAYPAMEPSGT